MSAPSTASAPGPSQAPSPSKASGTSNALRLVFAGSPRAAIPSLTALTASRHEVAAVITREDSPQGRRRTLTPTPVAAAAETAGIPTLKANRLRGDIEQTVAGLQPDLGVIVAYGGLVREPLLSTPRLGWINLHFSVLPRWRGAAPVQHALMAGDEVTGASVFQLVEELDAGDVYGVLTQTVAPRQTAGELLELLADAGATLLVDVVDALADGTARREPQRGDVTLAPKLTLQDARIDFRRPARTVADHIRAVTPEPGAFAMLDGERLKIAAAARADELTELEPAHLALVDGKVYAGTTTGAIRLDTVQPAGRKAMPAADWWRGRPQNTGRVFE